jgi:hypothetical protein
MAGNRSEEQFVDIGNVNHPMLVKKRQWFTIPLPVFWLASGQKNSHFGPFIYFTINLYRTIMFFDNTVRS